jgi:hypothetical protein
MRKKVWITIGGIVIFTVFLWWLIRNSPLNEAFYVPEGFEGCVNVVYNIVGTPVLEVEDHTIQYHLDEDGVLMTYSPPDFGWEGKESSGLHTTTYYYVDTKGEILEEIPLEEIGQGTLGEYSGNGRIKITRYAVPIGKGISCEGNHEKLDELVDEKLKAI